MAKKRCSSGNKKIFSQKNEKFQKKFQFDKKCQGFINFVKIKGLFLSFRKLHLKIVKYYKNNKFNNKKSKNIVIINNKKSINTVIINNKKSINIVIINNKKYIVIYIIY